VVLGRLGGAAEGGGGPFAKGSAAFADEAEGGVMGEDGGHFLTEDAG